MRTIKHILKNGIMILVAVLLLGRSVLEPGDQIEQIRSFTRMIEFDYINWTLDALFLKNIQGVLNAPQYMTVTSQRKVVYDYLRLVSWVNKASAEVDQIYADPNIANPAQASLPQAEELRVVRSLENSLRPLAESVIQHQVSTVVADMDLAIAGQPVPPVLYHVTPLPNALIISPRSVIHQDADISLAPDLSTGEITRLEQEVEQKADVSALVVPIGGVGIYPTMVMSTTNLEWLLEVVAHEWTHNFLTLRPVGLQYMASEEMRTINETTANIAGKEIGRKVLERYYPELAPAIEPEDNGGQEYAPAPEDPNAFSFTREMHKTRVKVDELLAAGKTEEAETYMEQRRRFFWDHGYQIRKLNQAYFAFYGAYNDVPGGGAAGKDPVGPAVQELRTQSKSLADFLNRMAWVTSYPALLKELGK